MQHRDLEAVRAIYNHYVDTSTCTFALEHETRVEREGWFAERSERHPAVVAEEAGEVVAWAATSAWKSRCGYSNTAELAVYVRHDRLGQGLGKALYLDLIRLARQAKLHTLIGGVCTEHEASMRLHRSLGFQQVAHFKQTGYKFGRWLDVAYFQLML